MTQMKWRLNEGGGQAIYRLGVDDCGAVTGLTAREMLASLHTFYKMAKRLGVDIRLLRERTLSFPDGKSTSFPQRKAIELQAKWKVSINQGVSSLIYVILFSKSLDSRYASCHVGQRRCWKINPSWNSNRRRYG